MEFLTLEIENHPANFLVPLRPLGMVKVRFPALRLTSLSLRNPAERG
jgi:hypothetical protein